MGDLWKGIQQFIFEGLRDNAFYRSLTFGIMFSVVITLVVGGIAGVFIFKGQLPYVSIASQAYWVAIFFVTLTMLFAILGYLSQLNVRDDLLTPLRKNIVGFWEVRSESWRIEKQKIEKGWSVGHCTIGIEQLSGKLLMRFQVSNSDVFKNQSIDVTTTAFSFEGVKKKLVYFHDTELELKNPLANERAEAIPFPFLGVLTLLFEDGKEIDSMDGHWYDIDNSIYHLARRIDSLTGFHELREALENGAVTFGGRLEFKRLKALPGMQPHHV
jgi:hypothetical protein